MNRMINTSTAILASTAPVQGSSSLLAMPRPSAATTVPYRLAHPAKHHHHERIDDAFQVPTLGPTLAERDNATPPAGDAGQAEGQRVDARAVLTPIARAIARIRARRARPRRVLADQKATPSKHRREADDHQAVPGQISWAAPSGRRSSSPGSPRERSAREKRAHQLFRIRLMPQVASRVSAGGRRENGSPRARWRADQREATRKAMAATRQRRRRRADIAEHQPSRGAGAIIISRRAPC